MTTNREEYFKAYEEYSRVLRTWLVAYGIGGPVLLLTNETLANAIKKSGHGEAVALCFLAGVALQILLAVFNKVSMWGIYYGELENAFRDTRRYKLCHWLSEQFWTDLLIDILTLTFFAFATWTSYQAIWSQ